MKTLAYPGLALDHRHDWDNGVFDESLAMRLFDTGAHAVGLGVRLTHTGGTNPIHPMNFRQYSVDLAYAYEILTEFNAGILAGVRQGSANGETRTGYSITLGLMYTPDRSISYALCIRDLGRSIEYTLHRSNNTTVAGYDEFHPATTELSSTLRFPARNRAPFLSLMVAIENNHILKEFRYKGGLELLLFGNTVAARVGMVNASAREASGGLGLALGRFRIDYAIMPRISSARYDEISLKAIF
jgi:hypothetical protein